MKTKPFDLCKVCKTPLSTHDSAALEACVRKQFKLPTSTPYNINTMLNLGVIAGVLSRWGQPSPGVQELTWKDSGVTVTPARPADAISSKLLESEYVPEPEPEEHEDIKALPEVRSHRSARSKDESGE